MNVGLIMPSSETDILLFAFRYVLGRESPTSEVVESLLIKWAGLPMSVQRQVQSEIDTAIRQGRIRNKKEVKLWRKILDLPLIDAA